MQLTKVREGLMRVNALDDTRNKIANNIIYCMIKINKIDNYIIDYDFSNLLWETRKGLGNKFFEFIRITVTITYHIIPPTNYHLLLYEEYW